VKRRRFSARAVLFDWDGTLVNSYGADSRAYLAMFQALGIEWGLDDLARHYSTNWYRVYRAAHLPRVKWDEADRIWTRAYKRENPRLMPGAKRSSVRFSAILFWESSRAEIARACTSSFANFSSATISRPASAAKTLRVENRIPPR
jgi:beta-phosphoglucomutase-like phosphatase (HAD superfamily)